MKKISRREFIKTSFATAGTVVASSGMAKAANAVPRREEPLATLIDISKCIGCEECVFACQESNATKFPKPKKPFPKMVPTSRVPVEDWSEKQDVTDRLTPYNWLYIQHAQVNVDGEEIELTIPRRCMHCENPPCVKLCPWGAAKQEDNGLSRIDSDLCLGGSKCKTVCPWDIPQRQTGTGLYLDLLPSMAGNGVMYKCDRCYDKLENGEKPACIEACPEDVQIIGPRDEILKQAHKIAKEIGGYIYGEHENGGTNTIYVSPVPFDLLNKKIETGVGKPHLFKVKDLMADGTNIAKAMIIAPIAGVLAALGKIHMQSKKEK
ncbi:4Fe-4S dicluster domain-containing protein [Desulfobacula sp.]|uniref:4Fe-4S dicluster domain-containing protein n=1 Tax=Desulfobacula sp. TaxID=2593537 RepID=UPI001D9416B5|nr:4Fe-4S dicluster domain-containing protein [Desulfobacula sp.]